MLFGLFFVPADSQTKSAQQLKTTVLLFLPLYFSCWLLFLAPLCTVVNGRYSRLVPIFLVPMSFINVSDVLICQFFNYYSHLFFSPNTSNILESDFPVECSGLFTFQPQQIVFCCQNFLNLPSENIYVNSHYFSKETICYLIRICANLRLN